MPYSAHGIYSKLPIELTELIEKYRDDIHKKFENELRISYLIDSLVAVDSTPEIRKQIESEKQKNKTNLDVLVSAAIVCYDHIDKCVQAHDALVLQAIDENALELPPPPTASMRVMDPLGNIYSRDESTRLMTGNDPNFNEWVHKVQENNRWLWIPLGYSLPSTFTSADEVTAFRYDAIGLSVAGFLQNLEEEDFPGAGKSRYYNY